MRSFALLAAAAGVVAAGDWSHGKGGSWGTGAVSYVTETVSSYTTYCPGPTEISHAGKTYTVTTATTLTLDCPCTITKAISTFVTSSCTAPSAAPTVAPVMTKSASPSSAPAKVSSYFPSVASPSKTTSSALATYTGSANKLQAAGAGLLAVVAAAAAL